MTAQALDVPGDLADAAALRSLEEHVLVEVGEAFLAGAFVGAAHAGPDLELDDGRAAALAQQDGQAVVEDAVEGRGREAMADSVWVGVKARGT